MWEEIFHFRPHLKPRAEILQKREREAREARDASASASSAAQVGSGTEGDVGTTGSDGGESHGRGTTPTPASTPVASQV